jgi:hypothetical protein
MALFRPSTKLPPDPRLTVAAGLLLLAYAAALIALWRWAGLVASARDLPYIFLLLAWQIGPVAAAVATAKASATRTGQAAFLLLEAAIILHTAWANYDGFVLNPDPQQPIALLIFVPLEQYGGFILAFGLAALFGWRARQRWMKT